MNLNFFEGKSLLLYEQTCSVLSLFIDSKPAARYAAFLVTNRFFEFINQIQTEINGRQPNNEKTNRRMSYEEALEELIKRFPGADDWFLKKIAKHAHSYDENITQWPIEKYLSLRSVGRTTIRHLRGCVAREKKNHENG